MSRERATYERLICDGCGEAVLEASDLDRAARDHGWVEDMCPLCHPYPYQQSDGHWIVGPQCFSDPDKTVINWQGENYYSDREAEVSEELVLAQVTIQQVRDLCERASFKATTEGYCVVMRVVEARDVLRILDGAR